jgi:predicted membrane chloride channel (bestrophin family)
MIAALSLAALSLVSIPRPQPLVAAASCRCPAASCRLSWRPPPASRRGRAHLLFAPSYTPPAEEGLTFVLRKLVRKTASHTVGGRGRDWRSVFERLDTASPDGLLGVQELRMAVHEIAGPQFLRDGDEELEAIVRRYDRNGDGKLSYCEFETMLKTLLRIPHDKVMLRSSPIAQPERYSTDSIWFSSLKNFGGSQVLRSIWRPLLAVTFCSTLIALIQSLTGTLPGGRAGKSLVQMHSLLGGALSLLLGARMRRAAPPSHRAKQRPPALLPLDACISIPTPCRGDSPAAASPAAPSLVAVFRTNSAYNRFWEARRIWESVLNRCRELARFLHLYREHAGTRRVALLVSLLCAYPRELRTHLVGEAKDTDDSLDPSKVGTDDAADEYDLDHGLGLRMPPMPTPTRLSPPLPRQLAERIARSGNRPLYVCKWLATELKAIKDSKKDLSFTSRERLVGLNGVNQLASYVGACERLLQTPVPLNYARHTSRFLTLWCLTLPISLVDTMGLLVVPVTAFVTWCLFGIQEIGLFIEHCALDDGAIFMDTITEQIALDVLEAVEEEEPLDSLEPLVLPTMRPQPPPPQPAAAKALTRPARDDDEAAKAAWLSRTSNAPFAPQTMLGGRPSHVGERTIDGARVTAAAKGGVAGTAADYGPLDGFLPSMRIAPPFDA